MIWVWSPEPMYKDSQAWSHIPGAHRRAILAEFVHTHEHIHTCMHKNFRQEVSSCFCSVPFWSHTFSVNVVDYPHWLRLGNASGEGQGQRGYLYSCDILFLSLTKVAAVVPSASLCLRESALSSLIPWRKMIIRELFQQTEFSTKKKSLSLAMIVFIYEIPGKQLRVVCYLQTSRSFGSGDCIPRVFSNQLMQ